MDQRYFMSMTSTDMEITPNESKNYFNCRNLWGAPIGRVSRCVVTIRCSVVHGGRLAVLTNREPPHLKQPRRQASARTQGTRELLQDGFDYKPNEWSASRMGESVQGSLPLQAIAHAHGRWKVRVPSAASVLDWNKTAKTLPHGSRHASKEGAEVGN